MLVICHNIIGRRRILLKNLIKVSRVQVFLTVMNLFGTIHVQLSALQSTLNFYSLIS